MWTLRASSWISVLKTWRRHKLAVRWLVETTCAGRIRRQVLCLVRLLLHLRQQHRHRRCLYLLHLLQQILQHQCLQPALQYRLVRLRCRCQDQEPLHSLLRLRHLRQRQQHRLT